MPASLSQVVKAGNIGDVFKHACLIELFQGVSNQPGPQLIYIESHSGSASYPASTLKADGKWAGERQWSLEFLLSYIWQADGLRLLRDHIREDDTYPGSPTLALRYLPRDASLIFYELNPDAGSSISAAERKFGREGVEVCPSDGFTGVRQHLVQASGSVGMRLVFIDPWYRTGTDEKRDWEAALEVLRIGRDMGASIVVWFPKKLRNKPFPSENDLTRLAAQGISRAEIWFEDAQRIPPWAGQDLAGCGLLWTNTSSLSAITEHIGQELEKNFAGMCNANGRKLDLTFLRIDCN